MKDFEYYEKKPESSIRSLSDLERYEIFNLESAEKYDSASNIDFKIDEEGNKMEVLLNTSEKEIKVKEAGEVLFAREFDGEILGVNGTLIRRI